MHKAKLMAVVMAASMMATGYARAEQKAAAPAAAPTRTSKLDRQQIDALLARPGDLVILDVRRPDELTRIGGFPAYLSIQYDDIDRSAAFIPKDRKIVTVSNHAGRALKAGDALAAKGFNVVGAIGVQNYEEEGGKLTRIEAKAPATASAAAVSR